MRESWEQTRQVLWAVLKPYQPKGVNLTPQKVMAFPWDAEQKEVSESGPVTQEQYAGILEYYAAIDAKRKLKSDC